MDKSFNTGTTYYYFFQFKLVYEIKIFSGEWTTCVIGDVAFEVEWMSIVHWKHDLPLRRLCRATAMLSLFNAINIHDLTTDTRIRVSWG